MAAFYVYVPASRSRALYVDVTNDMARHLGEHRDRHPAVCVEACGVCLVRFGVEFQRDERRASRQIDGQSAEREAPGVCQGYRNLRTPYTVIPNSEPQGERR